MSHFAPAIVSVEVRKPARGGEVLRVPLRRCITRRVVTSCRGLHRKGVYQGFGVHVLSLSGRRDDVTVSGSRLEG
jgi:hypothetical protein